MPENTVSVTRPGPFGNPFRTESALEAGYLDGAKMATWAYREWLRGAVDFADQYPQLRATVLDMLPNLRGKNLACFCALDKPCHADVLLEIANAPVKAA
jgi:hypothetical protein